METGRRLSLVTFFFRKKKVTRCGSQPQKKPLPARKRKAPVFRRMLSKTYSVGLAASTTVTVFSSPLCEILTLTLSPTLARFTKSEIT